MVAPDGRIVPDPAGELPGHGIWISATRQAVETACRKRLFARAARQPVTVDADLADIIEALLVQRCLGGLGLARRAGQLVLGFERVQNAVQSGTAKVLLMASDAGPHGRKKLAGGSAAEAPKCIDLLSRQELSLALGKENVVHAALLNGGLATRFLRESGRLSGFRAAGGTQTPATT